MVVVKEVKVHFNDIAHIYDKFKAKNQYYYDYIKDMILDITSDFSYSSVLDVGCGTGEILNHLKPERGIGIDISPKMIFFAKNKFKKYNFINSDFNNLSLNDKFDLILIIDVIEHLENLEKSLSRIKDFSNNNTNIIISSPSYYWRFVLFLAEKMGLKMPEGSHEWIPPKNLKKLIKKNGFKIKKSGYRLFIPKKIPFFSDLINSVSYRIPVIKNLGLVFYVVCKIDENHKFKI